MPNLTHFDDKIRRSSSFRSMTDLQDYLEYASHCRDELQIYYYMEENNIYTDNPQFWLAMLNVLKQRCQLKLIIKKLSEIKKNTLLREHQEYYRILLFEDKLTNQLQNDIRKRKARKRRSIQEYELFSISKIQKKKRKVGGIEIYVDQDCRENYKLEDYSEFFINNMKDQIQARRNEYDRKQQNKPLSFLGMHESNIQKWSFQLIEKNKRNSFYHQLQNNGRQSMIFRDGKNDDNNRMQSNNVSKRFSISRKSNINTNLLAQNNPQSGFKTPKETIIFTQTPVKNNRHEGSNKNKQIGTPVMLSRKYINDQSLIKACKKSEKYGRKMIYSSSGSQQQDITKQLNQQIINAKKDYLKEDDDDFSFNYPPHKQEIRVNKQQVQLLLNDEQIHAFHKNIKEDKHFIKNLDNNKESTLDLGCVQWSEVEDDRKMDVEGEIDRQLKETIFMTQLQRISTFINREDIDGLNNDNEKNNKYLHLESTPVQSMFCEQDSYSQKSLSEINEVQDSTFGGVVMCLKSTQTLQSIDSNQQNLFSVRKYQQSSNNNSFNLQAFKKDRKLFQIIPVEDRVFVSNNDNNNDSNQSQQGDLLQIRRRQQYENNIQMMSQQGNEQIKQMIDEMDYCQRLNNNNNNNCYNNNSNNSKNIVLQTLRKKKMSQLLMQQIIKQDQRQHGYGTHSQKKSYMFHSHSGLMLISQQKSYNSERRYNNNTHSNNRSTYNYSNNRNTFHNHNQNHNHNNDNNNSQTRERFSSGGYFGDCI